MPRDPLEEAMSEERRRRYQLPLLGLALVATYAASRFEPTRELGGYAVALGIPVVAGASSLVAVRHSQNALRLLAVVVALLLVATTESHIAPALWSSLDAELPRAPAWLLVLTGAGAVTVDVWAARAGIRPYTAAWAGLALVLAAYLPGRVETGRVFDFVFAGALFAMFLGGGTGLLLAAMGRRLTMGRAPRH